MKHAKFDSAEVKERIVNEFQEGPADLSELEAAIREELAVIYELTT